MAPPATPRPRGPPLPPFLLLLLLLLLAGSARGNEGGAAGSCQCRKLRTSPRFLEKLQSCDTCKDLARFHFPNRSVCGLKEDSWVTQLKNSLCQKGHPEEGAGRGEASRGHHLPAPTSPTTAPTPTSPHSSGGSPEKSLEEPQPREAWAPATGRSPPEPSAEVAAGEANLAPLEEEEASASDAKTPSVTVVLCVVALVVVGSGALAYCWRRRRRSRRLVGRRAQAPLGGEEDGTLCWPEENT